MPNDFENAPHHDIVFVDTDEERRAFEAGVAPASGALPPPPVPGSGQRSVAGMKGQYQIGNARDGGNQRVFACSVLKMTPRAIEMAAPITGVPGEWVKVHFSTFGHFEGPILKNGPRSLVMKIVATAEEASKVADKIASIEGNTQADGRRHERHIPADPQATVTAPNGARIPCEIIDYSASGTAIFTELEPEVGSAVKIGDVVGRVVRRFAGGFAVEFAVIQDERTVESMIRRNS